MACNKLLKTRKQFLTSYQQQTEYLRNELPINIYSQVVGTQHRNNMSALKKCFEKIY